MKPTQMCRIASIADRLRDDDVHIFLVPYRREQKREPLRQILGAYIGISGRDVMLADGEFGRPELAPAHNVTLGFNWSHSGDHALIAVGRYFTPGIDIERQRDRARALDIAEHYFCKDELAVLASTPVEARSAVFLELWTAKEAVLKALGRGIAFGLDRLRVESLQGRLILRWLDGDDALAWQLHRLNVGDDYAAALAWRGSARNLQCWTVAV